MPAGFAPLPLLVPGSHVVAPSVRRPAQMIASHQFRPSP